MKEIIKEIEDLAGKYSAKELFRDFVTMQAIAISNAFNMNDRLEKEYMHIVARYRKDDLSVFVRMSVLLIEELSNSPRDVLGEIFMAMGVGNSTDQHFTPFNVASLMSTLTSTPKDLEAPIIINDPTCGSGVTIIAKALELKKQGINYQEAMKVYASDIDRTVLLMCYVQLSYLGINAVCEVKDALTKNDGEKWYTPRYFF